MEVWKITASDNSLPELFFEVDSFDKALEKAREVNSKYDSGQIVRKEE